MIYRTADPKFLSHTPGACCPHPVSRAPRRCPRPCLVDPPTASPALVPLPREARWPALLGLVVVLRRLGAFARRDLAFALAVAFAPFVLALGGLRRLGLREVGRKPDPDSLPERLAVCFDRHGFGAVLAAIACVLWPLAVIALVCSAATGGAP